MHQQIRVKLGTHTISDGSGAMALTPVDGDPIDVSAGALLELLQLLEEKEFNLRLVGGSAIEMGGELVLVIHDEDRNLECAALLKERGYHGVRLVEPHECEVADEPGALAACVAELTAEGRQVDQIFVGTPHDGHVLIHATTVRRVESRQD